MKIGQASNVSPRVLSSTENYELGRCGGSGKASDMNSSSIVNKKAGNPPEIFIYDDIGPDWQGMVSGETIVRALHEIGDVPRLVVRINSPGGDVFEAMAIYNALERHPAFIEMKIDGLAASAASYIAMAGDHIEIAQNSFLMIHNAWTIAMGNADDLLNTVEVLQKIDDAIVNMYAARTGQSKLEIRQWMAAETWLSSDEAVAKGFADTVGKHSTVSASVPKDRYRNTPAALIRGDKKPFDKIRRDPAEQFPIREAAKRKAK